MGKESFFPTIEEVIGREIDPKIILSEQIYYIERLSHKISAMLKEEGNMITLCVGMKDSPFKVPIVACETLETEFEDDHYPVKIHGVAYEQIAESTEQFCSFVREIFHSESCMHLLRQMLVGRY